MSTHHDDFDNLYPELAGASPIVDAQVPDGPAVGHGLAAALTGAGAVFGVVGAAVGLAASAVRGSGDSAALFARHASKSAAPRYTPLPGWSAEGGLHAYAWSDDPRLVVIEGAGEVDVRRGKAQLLEPGVVALDARSGPVLELHAGGRRFLARFSDGRVRLYELPDAPSRMADLVVPPRAERPDMPVDFAALLSGASCDPRLDQLVRGLADGGDLLNKATALGYFMRLRAPTRGAEAGAELRAAMEGEPTPSSRTMAFVRAQPSETWDALEDELQQDAVALVDRATDVLWSETREATSTTTHALSVEGVLRARDELESVATVLQAAGRRAAASDAREIVDAVLRLHLSELTDRIALRHSYPLEAVADTEPEAYWATAASRAE
jgi:hypothetical protein